MKKTFFLCVLLALALAGCKSSKALVAASSDLDGRWGVIEMNGKALDPEVTGQELTFDVERLMVSGSTGCNTLGGQIEFNEKRKEIIRLLKIVSTRKGCMDMSGENEMLKTLNEVVRYGTADRVAPVDTIFLYGLTGEKIMSLSKK
ncbi:META domain-containing protein [Parabacteroides sp. Marseille-P3160]|mgnify:CR=1 FL=1|uniref:META domain-containing protein n=1 Tax=Parabacteroides sp. Marseille-P3160 TaxID=1917887 RepID=UPI0009BA59F2|nr:META domain-containing protein [Parabacteroides sp. Marseille-P3160]